MSKTILLADDEDNDALLLGRAFRKGGMDVKLMRVKDGEEAIAYLEGKEFYADRQQFPFPQLLILDLKMPRRSGFDVLKWMRNHDRFKRLITVVLTSSKQSSDINYAYELGANCYVVKPLNFEQPQSLSVMLTSFLLDVCESPELTHLKMSSPLTGKS